MLKKLIPLMLIPFLLAGCPNNQGNEEEPKGEDPAQEPEPEGDPSGDPEPGTDPEGDPSGDPVLISVKLFDDLKTASDLTASSKISDSKPTESMNKYLSNRAGDIVSGFYADNCFAQNDGKDNLYLTVGSSGDSGSFILNFSRRVEKIELSLACWAKWNSYAGSWNCVESVALADFGHENNIFVCTEEDSTPIVNKQELDACEDDEYDSYNKYIEIGYAEGNGIDGTRTVVREMVIYYYEN